MVNMVGGSCLLGEWDVWNSVELEDAVLTAYLEGLRLAGWQGVPSSVRLGYVTWLALQFGLVGPTLTAIWTHEDRQARAAELFGGTPEDLAQRWRMLTSFSLERAEEARVLLAARRR